MSNGGLLKTTMNELIKIQSSKLEIVKPFNTRIKSLIQCILNFLEENTLFFGLKGTEGPKTPKK